MAKAPPENNYADIAVPLPVRGTFTYKIPGDLKEEAEPGKRALVPFGGRNIPGYILEFNPPGKRTAIKDIIRIIDPHPLFYQDMVKFFQWLSDYYHYPIGKVIQTSLPGGLSVKNPGKGKASAEFTDRVGLLNRVFIGVKQGAVVSDFARGKTRTPENEEEFLDMVNRRREVPLGEIKKSFSNGEYLANKWIRMGLLEKSTKPVLRGMIHEDMPITPYPPSLNPKQKEILGRIREKLKKKDLFTYLIHGVTGSGKTEVYYHAVATAAGSGMQSVVMVPEIALTAYMASLFRARLGDEKVAVLHSGLSPGERYEQWLSIAKGEKDVVVGARSALFAPLPRLGLVIVDEEHDTSYKQEEKFRYQARDAAIVRARLSGSLVLLGSGTPSLQSFHNAAKGKYGILSMPERIFQRRPPEIKIVDMRNIGPREAPDGILSPRLRDALGEVLGQGKQSILFLNKRGFSALYLCRFCGEPLKCPNCDVSLTYHKERNYLLCHYCGYSIKPPETCPSCARKKLRPYGFGTEKVEETLKAVFPQAGVDRMDRDTMKTKGTMQQVLKRFLYHETDMLVGTQMVTKGHHFPNVTLVGVISADLSLNGPDFRAGETTFQLLSQVAGRSGRGESPGRVIIQTFNPSHYAIAAARDQDYQGFFAREIELRRRLNYPPFSFLANLRVQGNSKVRTEESAQRLGAKIRDMLTEPLYRSNTELLGPVEAPLSRLKGKYRYQMLLKSRSSGRLKKLLTEIDRASSGILGSSGVRLAIDVDPYQMR